MKTLLADFHIHTLLSPCAEIEMTPHHIVLRAAQYGVDAVAITDHNASANAAAARCWTCLTKNKSPGNGPSCSKR